MEKLGIMQTKNKRLSSISMTWRFFMVSITVSTLLLLHFNNKNFEKMKYLLILMLSYVRYGRV